MSVSELIEKLQKFPPAAMIVKLDPKTKALVPAKGVKVWIDPSLLTDPTASAKDFPISIV